MKNASHHPAHPVTCLSMKKNLCAAVFMFAACIMSGVGYAQVTLTDLGATAPTPGAKDISQFSTVGNQTSPDNLNYYTDNQISRSSGEPGQTFTTGANSGGYVLTSISVKTSGLNSYSGISTPQPYYLHLYSVSGSTVTLLQTYTSAKFTFSDGDWLKWANMYVSLAANTTYAWSFGKASTTNGWEAMAVATNNPYSGGQIALIPPGGGTMTFGSSHNFDAVFDVGLAAAGTLIAGTPIPNTNNIYIGSSVTLTSSVSGTPPYFYQWQTDGGSGVLTNIPNATNAIVTVTPSHTGPIQFDFIVTNNSASATSGVAVVTVNPLPGTANVYVNVSQSLASLPLTGIGTSTAVYENSLANSDGSPAIAAKLSKAAGIGAFRFPGGSYADVYNWRTASR